MKCDKGEPRCGRCDRLGHHCEYPFRNPAAAYISYAAELEEEIAQLEVELERLDTMPTNTPEGPALAVSPSVASAPGQDRSLITEDSSRYLGASSGMAFIEAAIQLAQARGILDASVDDVTPTEPPRISSDIMERLSQPATPLSIPPRGSMRQLFETFSSAQWQYCILTLEEYDELLDSYYENAIRPDPVATSAVHLVLATSLHVSGKVDNNIAASSLAEAHHEKALGMLGPVVRKRTLQSLQVVLLLLLFSMVNPQKPIVWQVLGTAVRVASSMRLHTEQGIHRAMSDFGVGDELPRRIFWAIYSMDRAVGNTLGRPTALPDSFITCKLPGASSQDAPLSLMIPNHCFQLRQLQSEVADILYHRTSDCPADYISNIQNRLDRWFDNIPIQSSNGVLEWFHHSYYNLCMFIHRPSPVNPSPSSEDLHRCFDAASHVIQMYSRLDARGSIDTTWMAVHWLFLAAVTQLFCLWTDGNLRREADWSRINDDIQSSIMVFSAMTERWKSGRKMLRLYRRLSKGTLATYTQIVHVEATSQRDGETPMVTASQTLASDMFSMGNATLDLDMRFWFDVEAMDYTSF